jgi:predicted DNA-binding transcriptional regulator AlpA
MSARRILMQEDLPSKGIRWHRSTIYRKVQAKMFPAPDGKTTDAPRAPNFWFESTIDRFLHDRAEKMKAVRVAK